MSVGVVMGSSSDLPVMRPAISTLDEFGVECEVAVVSAHRDPHGMLAYADEAADRGVEVIIAGAGGAAHLPGMIASATRLPVIGVPVPRPYLDGIDSLLSIVQMPDGIPVATMAIGGAANAALLALRILAATRPDLREALDEHRRGLRVEVARRHEIVLATLADRDARTERSPR